jgi:hypothetical protein
MARFIAPALAAALAVSAPFSVAQAAEVVGADAGLEFSTFTHDMDDLNKLTANGALEIGLTQELSVQGDFALSQMGFIDDMTEAAGLHAIYNLPSLSLGAFAGKDWIDGQNSHHYGIEAATAEGQITGQGYIGKVLHSRYEGTIFGARADFAAMPDLTVGARYDNINVDDEDGYRLSLTTGYTMGDFRLTGEIGRADTQNDGAETFLSVGAKMSFGGRNGTTFDRRGVISILPGL